MNSQNRTWFITGINRGLGRHLAEQILQRGERVAGTARDLSQLDELKAQYGERLWLTTLDLSDAPGIHSAVKAAFQAFGRLDVVISNAAYSLLGAAEELEDQAISHIIETNLIGSIQLARAAVPLMRSQGGGRIVQISSSAAQTAFAGLSLYSASKWGIEGFFEALAQELAGFGIGTTLVEPGAIRTDFGASGVVSKASEPYRDTPVQAMRDMLVGGHEACGDPALMASAILASVEQSPAPARLVLGSDAFAMVTSALESRLEQVVAQRESAQATDYIKQSALS